MIRLLGFLVAILFAVLPDPLRADMVYVTQYFSNDPIVTVNTASPSTPTFFASCRIIRHFWPLTPAATFMSPNKAVRRWTR